MLLSLMTALDRYRTFVLYLCRGWPHTTHALVAFPINPFYSRVDKIRRERTYRADNLDNLIHPMCYAGNNQSSNRAITRSCLPNTYP